MNRVTSKSIDGITDLVVIAPIKRGVIDAFENLTYESRLSVVAEALHKVRVNAREHETTVPFADTVERILTLFNFRIGIIDEATLAIELGQDVAGAKAASGGDDGQGAIVPKRFMFLAATFDGPLEPYLRLIWKPLGPFLDLLLCNCEGYKFATEVGFPEYLDWVRSHQVEPAIFYSTSGLTLRDQLYLSQLEEKQRAGDPATGGAASDRELAELTLQNPEEKARQTWLDPQQVGEALRLSLEALNVLYRLADYFPPDKPEGRILLRATRDLLRGLEAYIDMLSQTTDQRLIARLKLLGVYPGSVGAFTEQWMWFLSGATPPQLPSPEPTVPLDEVQKGLLSSYEDDDLVIRSSAVMMFSIRDAKRAGAAIRLLFMPSFEDSSLAEAGPYWPFKTAQGLAFTAQGLRKMGLDEDALDRFPCEFVEGMFKRGPMLGDVRNNHPRRWEFPLRRDQFFGAEDDSRPAIHTEEVDLVFQLRIAQSRSEANGCPATFTDYEAQTRTLEADLIAAELLDELDAEIASETGLSPNAGAETGAYGAKSDTQEGDAGDLETQLKAAFSFGDTLCQGDKGRLSTIFSAYDPIAVRIFILTRLRNHIGLRLLAVESGHRDTYASTPVAETKHADIDHFGFADGVSQPDPNAPDGTRDKVRYGDLLIGLPNSLGDREEDLRNYQEAGPIPLTYGSFMALRKIAQFPDRLEQLKRDHQPDVDEMIMGRRRNGDSLIPPVSADPNDFDFDGDTKQKQCPFSAHIRLANPRDTFQDRPAPRILRRGMSYGDRYDPSDPASASKDRGLLFIAYNASLAEQYEVIQKWLNRGNPTGVASAANDPLTGTAMSEGGYTFRYWNDATSQVERVPIKQPLTEVKYGLYAFVPSRSAIEAICELPYANPVHSCPHGGAHDAEDEQEALETIRRLTALSPKAQSLEWKRLIEDMAVKDPAKGNELPIIWQAIRNHMNGVLRLEHGVSFGDGDLPPEEQAMEEKQAAVLVTKWEHIEHVLSNPQAFSVKEQGRRTRDSFGAIYVSMDPDPADTVANPVSQYAREAIDTNRIVMDYGKNHSDRVFDKAYELSAQRLMQARKFSSIIQAGSGKAPFYKLEMRRDFLMPVLGLMCEWLFDIPDARVTDPKSGYIDLGAWGSVPVDDSGSQTAGPGQRKPRCPADFMAPSRRSFYPRPTAAIIEYGNQHGRGLRAASSNLVIDKVRNGGGFTGQLSALMARVILPKDGQDRSKEDLLARNIIGLMEGMLPPTDGLVRGIMFDWIDRNAIWEHQSRYIDATSKSPPNLDAARSALEQAVEQAVKKRPAPDLIYRTATQTTKVGDETIHEGDLVILALGSAMQEPDGPGYDAGIWPVFGGYRKDPFQKEGTPTHACPAHPIVMAMIYGMLAALFDAGRIVIQPASLILKISDWGDKSPMKAKSAPAEPETSFSPFT